MARGPDPLPSMPGAAVATCATKAEGQAQGEVRRVTVSNLCRWCGKKLDVVTTVDGRAVARQCPLCLDWAPVGSDVGREKPPKKAPTAAEQRARKKAKATKAARQGELFGK